ncbi:MAG: hypothetical protein F6K41_35555 [Symploca sp. SIO3E6]|nr:hypothetical protein [Caldora sp. SIO3E6]
MLEYQQVLGKIEEIEDKSQENDKEMRCHTILLELIKHNRPTEIYNKLNHVYTLKRIQKDADAIYEMFGIKSNKTGLGKRGKGYQLKLIELFKCYSNKLVRDNKLDYVPFQEIEPQCPPNEPFTGPISRESPYYVESINDTLLRNFKSIENKRESLLIRLPAPKGRGKSTALVNLQRELSKDEDHFVGFVDCQTADSSRRDSEDFDSLVYEFTRLILREFRSVLQDKDKPPSLKEYWNQDMDTDTKIISFLNEYVFRKISYTKSTLIIENFDSMLNREQISVDFCDLLRSVYESRINRDIKNLPKWPNIVIAYSTEPYAGVEEPKGSLLFNAGIPVPIPEFSFGQIKFQAKRYGLTFDDATVEKITEWIGGNPDLINRVLYHLASQKITIEEKKIDDFFREVVKEKSEIFDDYLVEVIHILTKNKKLAEYYEKTIKNIAWEEISIRTKLMKIGLVKYKNNKLVSCKLYQECYLEHLKNKS